MSKITSANNQVRVTWQVDQADPISKYASLQVGDKWYSDVPIWIEGKEQPSIGLAMWGEKPPTAKEEVIFLRDRLAVLFERYLNDSSP